MRLYTLGLVAALTVAFWAETAAAQDCIHNGEPVAPGTRVGDYKCENGRWVPV